MQISLSWIILFLFCYINDLFPLHLPTAHICVANFFQTEIYLTKLLRLVLFFSYLLFKLLLNTGELI